MRRIVRYLWSAAKASPTGLPLTLLGTAILVHAATLGMAGAAGFFWAPVLGLGIGLMLAIEYRTSAIWTAAGCASLVGAINGLVHGRGTVAWGFGMVVYGLAMTSGVLAAFAALVLVMAGRVRPNGGDAWAAALLPVMLVVFVGSLLLKAM